MIEKKIDETELDNGFYRLEIITPNKPSSYAFGKFSTVLELKNNAWKFRTDATTNTDFVEYEKCYFSNYSSKRGIIISKIL